MLAPAYLGRVDGALDRHLSRWLWLVKWFLAIPHYVVLAFLWLAFVVMSVVGFFAILFTGRYPQANIMSAMMPSRTFPNAAAEVTWSCHCPTRLSHFWLTVTIDSWLSSPIGRHCLSGERYVVPMKPA
jgi:hypothetical protein